MEWRSVPSFPDYEVSEFGDVRRAVAAKGSRIGKQLKPWVRDDGYRMFILRRDGRSLHRKAHQLVAEAFHGSEPFPSAEVCHNDGTRSNDHFSNLRWGTRAENHADKVAHGTAPRGENQGAHKLTAAQVEEIKAAVWGGELQRVVAERFGVRQPQVSRIMAGKRRRYG